jgi:hypothetical protein
LAVSPDDATEPDGFTFNRYGVRVPAVIVSPYMPPGEIVRAPRTGFRIKGHLIPSITPRSSQRYASSSILAIRSQRETPWPQTFSVRSVCQTRPTMADQA